MSGRQRTIRVGGSMPVVAAILATALVLAIALPVRSADPEGEPTTANGEVVDLACYMTRGEKGRGPEHADCAEMCAKGGAPLGPPSADGSLLLLVEDHTKPAPYADVKKLAGKQAEVQGKKFNRGGISALMVAAAKGS